MLSPVDKMLLVLKNVLDRGEELTTVPETAAALAKIVLAVKTVRETAQKDIADAKEETKGALSAVVKDMDDLETRLVDMVKASKTDVSDDLKDAVRGLKSDIEAVERLIPDVPSLAPLYAELTRIEKSIPKATPMPTAKETRDALETLEDDERLDASAIKGLERFIQKVESPRGFFGGFFGGRPVTIKDRGTILSKNIRVINFLGTEANVNAGADEVTIEPIVVSDTAPSAPFEHQLWVDIS